MQKTLRSKKEPILEEQGRKLRFLRKEYDLKQVCIAKKLGIAQRTYSKLENETMKITQKRLDQMAELYEISTQEIKDLKLDDRIVIHRIGDNHTGSGLILNQKNNISENERALFEKLMTEKDKRIEEQAQEIVFLRNMLKNKE